MLMQQLMTDLKTAMKSHDQVRLNTIRLIKSALMNEKIRLGRELTPDEELTVLSREKKQRLESISEFEHGKRPDLVAQSKQELALVSAYLPQELSETELTDLVKKAITATKASKRSEFGKVMKVLMPEVKGRADGKIVAKLVQSHLN